MEADEEGLNMASMATALPGVRHSPQGLPSGPGFQRFPNSSPQLPHLGGQHFQFAGQTAFGHPGPNPTVPSYAPSHSPSPQGTINLPPYMQQSAQMQRPGVPSPISQGFAGSGMFSGQPSPSHPLMYYQTGYETAGAVRPGLQGVQHLQPLAGLPGGNQFSGVGHGALGAPGMRVAGQTQRPNMAPGTREFRSKPDWH